MWCRKNVMMRDALCGDGFYSAESGAGEVRSAENIVFARQGSPHSLPDVTVARFGPDLRQAFSFDRAVALSSWAPPRQNPRLPKTTPNKHHSSPSKPHSLVESNAGALDAGGICVPILTLKRSASS